MLYVARQPILDRQEQTLGYELLYRSTTENVAQIADCELASQSTLDTSVLIGVEELSNGTSLFINCARDFLVKEFPTLLPLPPELVVLEILETVPADPEVLAACRRLKSAGYRIALDDFVMSDESSAFLELADFLKIDLRTTPAHVCSGLVRHYAPTLKLIAEKVETRHEYNAALQMGFHAFQGYFFCEPVMLSAREITPLRMNHIRLIQATCSPELDFRQVEAAVRADAALCYRLLRYLNSAAFCLQSSITSIRHALALLGEREIRKWIAVSAVSLASEGKASELLLLALLRARFCELLSERARCKPYEAFIMGLFSTMEALLDAPLPKILSTVELPAEPRAALLGKPVRLRNLYEIATSYDRSGWDHCRPFCEKLGLSEEDTAAQYIESVRWVNTLAVADGPKIAAPN